MSAYLLYTLPLLDRLPSELVETFMVIINPAFGSCKAPSSGSHFQVFSETTVGLIAIEFGADSLLQAEL